MSLTIPTVDELYTAARAETEARDPSLTDWNDGSALDGVTGGGVILADQIIRIGLDRFAGRMIATATGSDLDSAVTDRYPDLPRNLASASIGTLHVTRGGSTGILTIPAGTQARATVNGRTITVATISAAYMPAVSSYYDVVARCTETGTAGNLPPNSLTAFVSALAGDATATVNNLDYFAGGTADESDDAYRARAQAYPATLRKGTIAALEEGALTVPGVAYVTVDESYVETLGEVRVYVGDPDGRGNSALSDLVETELENWRAAGVRVTVYPSSREEITLSLTVYVLRGQGSDALSAACRAAVIGYAGALAPSIPLYLSAAEAAAYGVSPASSGGSIRGAVASCDDAVGDTVSPSAAYHAIRVTDTTITVTLVEVA